MMQDLANCSCLPCKKGRRLIRIVIVVFKLLMDMEYEGRKDLVVKDSGRTWEHEHKLRKTKFRKDVKKFGFPNRIINTVRNPSNNPKAIQIQKIRPWAS